MQFLLLIQFIWSLLLLEALAKPVNQTHSADVSPLGNGILCSKTSRRSSTQNNIWKCRLTIGAKSCV